MVAIGELVTRTVANLGARKDLRSQATTLGTPDLVRFFKTPRLSGPQWSDDNVDDIFEGPACELFEMNWKKVLSKPVEILAPMSYKIPQPTFLKFDNASVRGMDRWIKEAPQWFTASILVKSYNDDQLHCWKVGAFNAIFLHRDVLFAGQIEEVKTGMHIFCIRPIVLAEQRNLRELFDPAIRDGNPLQS